VIRLHLSYLRWRRCLIHGHRWQDRSWPISCSACGKSVRMVG
jgi:hypothetical protein